MKDKTIFRRLTAWLLTMVMVVNMVPVQAFAAETDEHTHDTGSTVDTVVVKDEDESTPDPVVVDTPADETADDTSTETADESTAPEAEETKVQRLINRMDALLARYGITAGMTEAEIRAAIDAVDDETYYATDDELQAIMAEGETLTEAEQAEVESYGMIAEFGMLYNAYYTQNSVMPLATTVTPVTGIEVTDSIGNGSLSGSTVTIKASGWWSSKTNTVTITNVSGSNATISFDYEFSGNIGSKSESATSGTYSGTLSAGGTYIITFSNTSQFMANTTATLTLSNFSIQVAATSYSISVKDNDSRISLSKDTVTPGEEFNVVVTPDIGKCVESIKVGETTYTNATYSNGIATFSGITVSSDSTVSAVYGDDPVYTYVTNNSNRATIALNLYGANDGAQIVTSANLSSVSNKITESAFGNTLEGRVPSAYKYATGYSYQVGDTADFSKAALDWDRVVTVVGTDRFSTETHYFGANAAETVYVTIPADSTGKYRAIDYTITVIIQDERQVATINYVKPNVVEFETEEEIIEAVLGASSTNSSKEIIATSKSGTLPTAGNSATLVYTLSVAEDDNYLANSIDVEIDVKAKSNPAEIDFVTAGTGSGHIDFGGLTDDGTLATGAYSLTVIPSDVNGNDGSVIYVDKVELIDGNGGATTIDGTYANGVFTASSIAVINDMSYTLKVTFGTETLTNAGGTLELNGYGADRRWSNLKVNVLSAVLGDNYGNENDYTAYVWGDFVGDPAYRDATDVPWTDEYKTRLNVPAYGTTGTLKVKIVKAASSDGKIPALTLETTVTTAEARTYATIAYDSSLVGKYDTVEQFKAGVAAAITASHNGADLTSNLTLSWDDSNAPAYTVTASLAETADYLATTATYENLIFDIQEYTITFDTAGGSAVESITQGYNTTYAIPAAPTKEGYTFDGWYLGETEVKAGDVLTVTGNATITATWTINQYTITFDTDGGSAVEPITKDFGSDVTAPADPTKEGYTFAGWDKEIPTTMPAEDVTITANWTINQYTITYVDTDGTTELGSITADYNAPITAIANPTKTGYTFVKWDKETPGTMPAGDMTITAEWKINQYTIKFDTVGGTAIADIKQDYGTAVTAPAVPTKTGYTFTGWDKEIPSTMPAGDVTITAQWKVNTYTVTWNVDGEETVVPYEYGAKINKLADPTKEGWKFTGWGATVPETMPANNLVFTAQWAQNQFVVTWYVDGNETKVPYTVGAEIEVPADPTKTGYTFTGWDKEIPATMPEEDLTFTATWDVNKYNLTWSANGGNFGEEAYTTISQTGVAFGTQLTPPTEPTRDGYTFKGWTGYTDGMTMPANDLIITADWSVNTYTVTWVIEGKSVTNNHEYGTQITVPTAPVKDDHRFIGWDSNGDGVVETVSTVMGSSNVTYTAVFSELFNVTWVNEGENYLFEENKYIAGETPVAPADPTKAADAQYTYTFTGWTPEVTAITGDTTYTAVYENSVNSYTIIFTDEKDVELDRQTLDYGETPVYAGETLEKEYYHVVWTPEVANVTGDATYKLVWTADNDVNNNEIADELETGTVTLVQTGNGNVTLTPDANATLVSQDGNVYTYLYDSTDSKNKVINVTTSLIDTDNTDGDVDYLISAPATVNVGETLTVEFGTHTLNANNGTVKINGYYEARANSNVFDTLKADVLNAAGLDGTNASNYTVVMLYSTSGQLNLDDLGGYNIVGNGLFFTAVEIPENRQFTITDKTTGVSKTVTMKIVDSRPSAGLEDTEITDVEVISDGETGLNGYVEGLLTNSNLNPNGLTVTYKLTEGSWPPAAAGVTTKLVYTVTYADSAEYIGDEAKLTVYVQSSYNNCTVTADDALTAGGSLTVSPSSDNTTVAGNDTVTITVTPAGDNVVETITVTKNGEAFATYTTEQISYNSKSASVKFKSDGSVNSDKYVVSVVYSVASLTLNDGQTVVYSYNRDKGTVYLKELIFNAVYDSSTPKLDIDDFTIEYKYFSFIVDGWQDVDKEPNFSIGTHGFGENVDETVRVTYVSPKYGTLQQEVTVHVFDSNFNNTIEVETVTNGADATIKSQVSPDPRKYEDVNYYEQETAHTVTLTPDGNFVDTLGQLYNGTYANSMAYIKSVTVKDEADNTVESVMLRGQGTLSLENILDGVNPMLYNATVTFTTGNTKHYTVIVEYGVLTLEQAVDKAEMEMYQGGTGYDAKVPSAQDLTNTILGEEYAANFLATYGGAFTVEFSSDAAESKWTEVSDKELLKLDDNKTIKVRITWNPSENDMTYYPVAVKADVTLVDQRTETSVAGEVPTKQVNFLSEEKLISELKDAMGLGILADDKTLDVEYTVTYTITGDETNGYFADVTVTYDGSEEYKPTTKTFENVPVANRPDDATIKVTIQNASDVVTNNDGKLQTIVDGVYTVIGNGTYKFTFTPVEGFAIESVAVNGEKVDFIYSDNCDPSEYDQTATFSMYLNEKEHYEVVVETIDSEFVPHKDGERVYDFAFGYDEPVNEDIIDSAIGYPTEDAIDYSKVEIEYMARKEGKVTVTLPDIDLGFTVVELGTIDIDLGELWLNPEETVDMVAEDQLDKILADLVDDIIWKVSHGELAATNAVEYIQNYVKSLPLGIHAFGAGGDGSVETIRISYEDDKYLLERKVTDVTIHDYRTPTEIVASDCEVTFGYSLEQLIAASGAYVAAEGTAVDGLAIITDDLYLHAKTEAQTVKLVFKGDKNYQPCELTINVIVNKAACSIDYDSQIVTYGDEYDFTIVQSPEVMPDGTPAEIDMIEFMIGLDMHKLLDVDVEDKDIGIDQAIAYIQLRLPQAIRDLPLVGEYLQGEFTLGELIELINSLSDYIGIDEGSLETLNQVIEAITGITDNMEIKVVIKDEDFKPSNIGVYIAGAVTVDADFETAYTADYLLIVPKTIEAELEWDYVDSNNIYTLPAYQEIFKDLMGAHVIENEIMTGETLETANGHVKYLILGINDETSEFLTTDVYGNIKANIWTSPKDINDNGAYVQIAYMLNWGNEIYYAMPIVRTFVIVPEVYDVQLLDNGGNANNDLLKEFNNQPQGFDVKVSTSAGDEVLNTYTGFNADDEGLTIRYIGLQTNINSYNSTEKPVHAGAYAAVATYTHFDENSDLQAVGMDVGVLVIKPTESTVDVENRVVVISEMTENIVFNDMVHASSTVAGLTPDTTVISAAINTDGTFSEEGLSSVQGNVNVDFPSWVDELIAEYAPSIVNGMTVAEFTDKITAKMPAINDMLAQANIPAEVIDALNAAVTEVTDVLAQVPENVTLSFQDDAYADRVGTYLVVGVVTDSDHMPSVDVGVLIITPEVIDVDLVWNYNDSNGIFTDESMQIVDLGAQAFVEEELHADYTGRIEYLFIGVDSEGDIITHTANQDTIDAVTKSLTPGVYTQVACIYDIFDSTMPIAKPIVRTFVVAPQLVDVDFVENTDIDNTCKFTYTGSPIEMPVKVTKDDGTEVIESCLKVTYTGVDVYGNTFFNSTEVPVNTGAYEVTALYLENDENGNLKYAGINIGAMVILPATAEIDVQYTEIDYSINDDPKMPTIINENGHTTIEVIVDMQTMNVNIVFPERWGIGEYTFEEGTVEDVMNTVLSVLEKSPEYTQYLEAIVGQDNVATIDDLIAKIAEVVEKALPMGEQIGAIMINGDKPMEIGTYMVAVIAADRNHLPAYDMDTLVILDHSYEVVTVDPTCTEDGYIQYTCQNDGCDYSYQTPLAAYGHAEVVDKAVDPTCTETGLTEGKHCSVCGETLVAQEVVPANGHTEVIDEGYDATCTTAGLTEGKHCYVCGETLVAQEVIPALGHTTVVDEAVDPTCTATGLTEGKHCSVCNTVLIAQEVVPANGHTPGNETVDEATVTPATCENAGHYDVVTHCTVENCGVETSRRTVTIAPKGHIAGEVKEVAGKDATCTADGYYYKVTYCGREGCGAEIVDARETVVLPKLGHDYKATVTEPTCTTAGYTTYTCSRCDDTYTGDNVKALGHKNGAPEIVLETCTEPGYRKVVCTVCDTVVEYEEWPALGHGLEISEVVPPTCEKAGYTVYACEYCDYTEIGDKTAALGHTEVVGAAVAPTCTTTGLTEGKHCERCGEITLAQEEVAALGHSYVATVTEPTCTEAGYTTYTCSACDDSYVADYVDATNHTYDEGVVTTAPTCTEKGVKTFTCEKCGHTYTEEVAALGHSYTATVTAPTCTEDGYTTHECSVCGDKYVDTKVDAIGHAYEATVTKEPTCTETGLTTYICANNENHRYSEPIEAIGHDYEAVVTAPTCENAGYTTYTCKNDEDHVYVDNYVDALGHDYKAVVTKDATCEADGEMTYTCQNDQTHTYTEAIPATGHTADEAVVENKVAATCTSEGSYDNVVYCSVCNKELSRETVAVEKLAHTEAEAVAENEVAATCTSEGSYDNVVYCSVCNEELSRETVTVDKLAHTAGEAKIEDVVDASCANEGRYDTVVRCSVCGAELSRETTVVPATAHTYNEVVIEPDCMNGGWTELTCEVCGDIQVVDETQALGHDYETVTFEPTCTEGGWTTYHCLRCGDEFNDDFVEPTGHRYNEVVIEPDCMNGGWTELTCEVCGDFQIVDETEALGHDYEAFTVAPTCEEGGYTRYTCAVCGEWYDDDFVEPLQHAFDDGVVTKEATCTEDGEIRFTCENDPSHVFTETIPATGHNYEAVVTEPTCTAAGYTTYTCSVCGDSYVDNYVSATGHAYEAKVTKEPTCTETGLTTYICANNENHRYSEPIEAIGHDYKAVVTAPTCENAGYTTYTCNNDDSHVYVDNYVDALGHDYKAVVTKEATCTEDGVMTYTCQNDQTHTYTETIPATGHTEAEAVIENKVEATATTDGGYDTVVYCSVCGEELSRVHTTIPATGHKPGEAVVENVVEATCTTDGSYDTVAYCSECGEELSRETTVVPATGHDYEAVVTEPTCTEAGYTTYVCENCDDSYVDDTVEALGHKFGEYVQINPFVQQAECERCDAVDVIENNIIYRVAGNTRYYTAFEIADYTKEMYGIDKFDTVIIASGKVFADALSGTYLANVKKAPILLASGTDKNNAMLKDYIDANLVSGGKVYILGSDAAIPYTLDAVLSDYDVERLAGKTRYDTNIEILKEAGVTNEEIMVCTGTEFADSLAASAVGKPILLVDNNRGSLRTTQKEYLATLNTEKFYIIGSDEAVCAELMAEMGTYGETERVAGSTRYKTSVAIAERFFTNVDAVVVACGKEFPDGLCGGVLAASMGAPIILSDKGNNPPAVANAYVQRMDVNKGVVLGSDVRIDDETARFIFENDVILNWK